MSPVKIYNSKLKRFLKLIEKVSHQLKATIGTTFSIQM